MEHSKTKTMIKIKRLNEETQQWEFDSCPESIWEEMQTWIENGTTSWILANEEPDRVPDVIKNAMDAKILPEEPKEQSDPNEPTCPGEPTTDYEEMTVKEIKGLLKEKGFKTTQLNKKKAELIEMLCE